MHSIGTTYTLVSCTGLVQSSTSLSELRLSPKTYGMIAANNHRVPSTFNKGTFVIFFSNPAGRANISQMKIISQGTQTFMKYAWKIHKLKGMEWKLGVQPQKDKNMSALCMPPTKADSVLCS